MNLFAVCSAQRGEKSWAKYCGPEAVVGGINLNTCLGDEFSSGFLEVLDAVDFETTPLGQVNEEAAKSLTHSNLAEIGVLEKRDELVKEYFGDYDV